MEEYKELIELFNRNFNFLKTEPIVLYGIGYRTEAIVNNLKDYNIVGLMDSNSSGYKVYGIDVLTKEEVSKITKNIILICIYKNANIIYKNIYDLEKNYNISIYHISGKKMDINDIIDTQKYIDDNSISEQTIKNKINNSDIISFDIFDTLIVRKVYQISDIFNYMQTILQNNYNIKFNFIETRILAEKEAYKEFKDFTNIEHIYHIIKNKLNITKELTNKIKKLEIDTEKLFITKRDDTVNLLKYAIENNKEVILTSDMYLNTDKIKEILFKTDIEFQGRIIISCELGKSKNNGDLWEYIKKEYKNKKILHIGDNEYSDIEQAKKYSIDTIKIYSSIELFNKSNIKDYFNNLNLNLDDRILLGHFIAYFFNSIFYRYTKTGKIKIDSHFNIGYSFFGPLIYNFMISLIKECKKNNINKILFISRDGYILEKLYNKYFKEKNIESIYFYTSRRTLHVISIQKEDDIINNINLIYKLGTKQNIIFDDFLLDRFGVQVKNDDIHKGKTLISIGNKENVLEHILLYYKKEILDNSSKERGEYLKYINNLNINDNSIIALVNGMGNGSTQYFIQKLFSNEMIFFYFATSAHIKYIDKKSKTISFYGEELDDMIQHYSMLDIEIYEPILTSPDGQFMKFENNKAIFDYDIENRYYSGINTIHSGISKFIEDITKINNKSYVKYNKELILNIFNILSLRKDIYLVEKVRKSFIFIDKVHNNINILGEAEQSRAEQSRAEQSRAEH